MKHKLLSFGKEMSKNKALYLMFLPAAVILILFNYLPMFGLITAFKDFNFADGIFGSPWISPFTKNFEYLFSSGSAARATVNTILLNLLFMSFPPYQRENCRRNNYNS